MKRTIRESNAFIRTVKRLMKKRILTVEVLRATLELLADDAFDPALKSHKLKGDLAGSWSCSLGYDLRLVYKFVAQEDSEVIVLQSIGTHDEIY